MVANGLSQPVVLPQLQKTHRTRLLLHSVPVAIAQLEPRHHITKVSDIVLGAIPAPAHPVSAPLDNQDDDGDDEDEEEYSPDNEQKPHKQVPKVNRIDLQLQRKRRLPLLRQFDAQDEALGQSVGLSFEEQ